MSRLSEALRAGRFAVTSELTPPKGTDLGALLERARALSGVVDAFNLTDSHAARMAAAPMAVGHALLDHGIEPIMQMTSRDRNRIALQSDMLGAAILGIENLVFMGGDPPTVGDHPEAKPVFDILSVGCLRAARELEGGHDLAGNPLAGTPRFCLGAVANPGAEDLEREVARVREKVAAGAEFLQTQAVYDPPAFARFAEAARDCGVSILAGIILLKSAKMARYLNEHVPGIHVPEALVDEIDGAADRGRKSVEIAARTVRELRPLCQGVHIMALGWEARIPEVIAEIRDW